MMVILRAERLHKMRGSIRTGSRLLPAASVKAPGNNGALSFPYANSQSSAPHMFRTFFLRPKGLPGNERLNLAFITWAHIKHIRVSTRALRISRLHREELESDATLASFLHREMSRMTATLELEAAVLGGKPVPDGKQSGFGTSDGVSLMQLLCEGDFKAVIFSSVLQGLFETSTEEGDSVESYLERQFLSYLSDATEDQRGDREVALLAVAVACLNLFAQSNWTGPPAELPVSDFLPKALLHNLSQSVLSSLQLDGESVYSLASSPILLLVTKVILVNCGGKLESLQLLPWWTLRYVALHQQILEERSLQLSNLMLSCIQKGKKAHIQQCQPLVCECEELFHCSAHRNLAILFHLECSYSCLTYYEYRRAKEHLHTARNLTGLDINMTGALGKRTRFQENFLAQLVLDVKRRDNPSVSSSESPSILPTPNELLPKDHQLSDDTVLNQINLAEPSEHELPDLSAEEQALILATCIDFQKNNPVHKLNDEELLAFTTVRLFVCLSFSTSTFNEVGCSQVFHLLAIHSLLWLVVCAGIFPVYMWIQESAGWLDGCHVPSKHHSE
ncbi:hypothetical protein DNTS_028649 [Danionella cerebrum]|uniref:Uncharacterized protein n=1 Tax=Danionella cerebrum TaxID=2873325 RepID=A0A553QLD0_9TELE|nr:hypothetical protein DNTS_028649 [Danionella translucida]